MKNSKLFEEVPIGSTVYGVHRNLWYAKGVPYPYPEFVVKAEEVKAHIAVGYNEVRTSDGATPYYYKASDFGKIVFFTAKEAAQEALNRTIQDENRYTFMRDEPPMRRTWEHYLKEEETSENDIS